MINFKDYKSVELERLVHEIEIELQKRKDTHYKNLIQNVLDAINEIDDMDAIAFEDKDYDWTWRQLANAIDFYHF